MNTSFVQEWITRQEAFARCESPAETDLYHILVKHFAPSHIRSQVWIGKYRCDFQIGHTILEIDGREFHDPKADELRDQEILLDAGISKIIRIPAAAWYWHRDACCCVLAQWLDGFPDRYRASALHASKCEEQFGDLEDDEEADRVLGWMLENSAWNIVGDEAQVGAPTAFLDANHTMLKRIEHGNIGIARWLGTIKLKPAPTPALPGES